MITEEFFVKLEDFIQSKIEMEIEANTQNDNTNEVLRYMDCRRDLRLALGLPEYPKD